MELETIFIEPFQKLDINSIIEQALKLNDDLVISTLQEQLLQGKGADGNDMRPYYSEDPFFNTPEEAAAYRAWKQTTPNQRPGRNPDAPNYYINGYTHRSLMPEFGKSNFDVKSGVEIGEDILRKNPTAFTHNQESLDLVSEGITPDFEKQFEEQLLKQVA